MKVVIDNTCTLTVKSEYAECEYCNYVERIDVRYGNYRKVRSVRGMPNERIIKHEIRIMPIECEGIYSEIFSQIG